MYPPGFLHQRKAGSDYKIPNSRHIIPKGHNVWIPAAGFHYDPQFWKNPQKFDPEHFSAEENAKRPSFVFSPFGELILNFIACEIIQNFKFDRRRTSKLHRNEVKLEFFQSYPHP
jgi:hypothetical protein